MIGDTPDDIDAARNADVVPIGVVAPGIARDIAHRSLGKAARVLDRISDLEGMLG